MSVLCVLITACTSWKASSLKEISGELEKDYCYSGSLLFVATQCVFLHQSLLIDIASVSYFGKLPQGMNFLVIK